MNLIPFEYNSKPVRVVQDEHGEPWWVAKDVCDVLGLSNTAAAVKGFDRDEKGIRKVYTPGGEQSLAVINEAGLYNLVIRSNKPEAQKFKRWITHEVLPSIRKSGKYEIEGLSEIDLIIRSAQALKQIETKQVEHDQRLTLLEAKSQKNSGYTGYWTITAWCKLNNLKIGIEEANRKGREATRLSNEWGIDVYRVPDERFGHVNSYREDVLEEIFESLSVEA